MSYQGQTQLDAVYNQRRMFCYHPYIFLFRLTQNITKQRNSETGIFSNFFFLNTETHKETNSADIGSVEK